METMNQEPGAMVEPLLPALYDDYHRTYLCCIYLFASLQFSLGWLLCHCFGLSWKTVQLYPGSSTLTYISMGILALVLVLLCIKPLNDINDTANGSWVSMLMQFLFTWALSLSLASAKWLCDWTFLPPMLTLLTFSTSLISLAYYFTRFDFITYHGMKMLMFGQMVLAAFLMSLYPAETGAILDGFNLALVAMAYLVYGTIKLTNCEQITFRMSNVLAGLSLIYTFFMISVYYRNK